MSRINTNLPEEVAIGPVVGYRTADVRPRRWGWIIWLLAYGTLAVGVAAWVWVMADWMVYVDMGGGPIPDVEVPHEGRVVISLLVGNIVAGGVLLLVWLGKVIWWKLSGRKVGPGL